MRTLDQANLLALPEWQYLIQHIAIMERDLTDACIFDLASGNSTQAAYAAGQIAMLREFRQLPSQIMPSKEANYAQESH